MTITHSLTSHTHLFATPWSVCFPTSDGCIPARRRKKKRRPGDKGARGAVYTVLTGLTGCLIESCSTRHLRYYVLSGRRFRCAKRCCCAQKVPGFFFNEASGTLRLRATGNSSLSVDAPSCGVLKKRPIKARWNPTLPTPIVCCIGPFLFFLFLSDCFVSGVV